jgi:CheY-like chemotaxis protein
VDDNSVGQLVVRGMLLRLGYRVKTVDSSLAALAALRGTLRRRLVGYA